MHKCCVLERQERSLPPYQHVQPSSIRSFVDEEGIASKSLCSESHNKSKGFVDLSDMMAKSLYFTLYCFTN
jgi:hypothetical protein